MPGPYFIPDVSSWQGDAPNFAAIAAAENTVGCILKSSQGIGPGVSRGHSMTWFRDNWARARAAGGSRYGSDWLLGSYHFATPRSTGTAQADYVLKALESVGWSAGRDIPPAWDLEGEDWTSAQQVIDTSSQFVDRIKGVLGVAPILYTGVVWRKFGLRTRLGFEKLWTTHMEVMTPFGWPNSSVVLHQYGNGKYYNPRAEPAQQRYPISIPGFGGDIDMNVVMDGGRPAASIDRVREVLTGSGGGLFNGGGFVSSAVREVRGISTPLLVGAGLGLLGLVAIIASAANDETY